MAGQAHEGLARLKRKIPHGRAILCRARSQTDSVFEPESPSPRQQTSASASGNRHHSIVEAVRPVAGAQPRSSAPVIGQTAIGTVDATGGQRGVDRPHSIGAAGGDTGSVGVRTGSAGAGRTQGRSGGETDGGGTGGGPAAAVIAPRSIVIVHRRWRVIRSIGSTVIAIVPAIGRRAIGAGPMPVAVPTGGGPSFRACGVPRSFATSRRTAAIAGATPGSLAAGCRAAPESSATPGAAATRCAATAITTG